MHDTVLQTNWLFLIPLLPLLGFAVNGCLTLVGKPLSERDTALVGCLAVLGSALLSTAAFLTVLGNDEPVRLVNEVYSWIATPRLSLPILFVVDRLSAVMIMVVCWIGLLIHIYSSGYMHGDPGFSRFFAYLNLFMFAMLVLVLGGSLPILFIGWEGVGLCSYLLIGFWYSSLPNAQAGKKAFVVNRIGDFGFLLGMFVLFWGAWKAGTPTLDVAGLQGMIEAIAGETITLWGFTMRLPTVAAILLFIGACGKSAQIPLYVWLPDAMAGPTPVSALIHAATMVTAGVYMTCRMHFLFEVSPVALTLVACVGAATALFAATIALVQNDIKKILAYSTVSQLGYMFLGVGAGAFAAGLFHVYTHAFFKACLFLGAGSVMHAMSDQTDIRIMGALRKKMPHTWATFAIATLAIAGVPGLSGFFSKDEILAKTYMNANFFVPPMIPGHEWLTHMLPSLLWFMGVAAATCTAFYMGRALLLTFHGEQRWVDDHTSAEAAAKAKALLAERGFPFEKPPHMHPHESPKSMTLVLWALALGAIVAGYVGVPHFMGGHNAIEGWLGGLFSHGGALGHEESAHALHSMAAEEPALAFVSTFAALTGLAVAGLFYLVWPALAPQFGNALKGIYRVLSNKYYVDELYERLFVEPIRKGSEFFLWKFVDVRVIDGFVRGTAWVARGVGTAFGRMENGFVSSYAVGMLVGTICILGYLVLR